MQLSPADLKKRSAAALAALQNGDAAGARAQFQALADAGAADASVWLGLAWSCRALGDDPAMQAALDKALAIEPNDLRALLLKADSLAARDDRRGALSFYALIAKLFPEPDRFPPGVAREIRRAHAARKDITAQIQQRIEAGIAAAGYDPRTVSSRFTQSLSLLTGLAQRYEQQPRSYFFPELPTIAFYPRETFPWMEAIEAETDAIRAELRALLDSPEVFAPYIEAESNRPINRKHALLDSEEWTACYLIRNGQPVEEIARRCPRTMKAIEAAPLERIPGRAPYVLFSKLTPGAWIRPHTGFLNTRLVCHLPLIVTDKCWFRVGAETRSWEEGKCFAFNDTIEHEARNEGSGVRTVLIFNIWRPELTEDERRLVSALMQSVDSA